MAIARKDYYVIDDWGDVYNIEPLPTFNQASQFRGMIKPLVNRITDLRIVSKPRGLVHVSGSTYLAPGTLQVDTRVPLRRKTYENSDF